jgi:hypothetical protein
MWECGSVVVSSSSEEREPVKEWNNPPSGVRLSAAQ